MKAVVLRKKNLLEIMDIPKPSLFEHDHVLVKVDACGICGSDIRYYHGENPWALHTLGYSIPPVPNIVLGHEFTGTVVEVNSKKYKHLLNARVIVQPWKGCGTCEYCLSNRENLCKATRHLGHGQGWPEMEYYPGAMAEYCIAWGDYVFEIPEEVSAEAGAMSDILGVAVHTVNRSRIIQGSDVVCLGGGPAGILTALVALSRGAEKAFLVEKSELAREIIQRFDNCVAIDADDQDACESIGTMIGPKGCSAIYDSIGYNDVLQSYAELLSPSGYYVNMATQDIDLILPKSLMSAERVVTSSSNACYAEIKESVDLIVSGKIAVEKIISHRCTFDTFLENFDLLLKEPKEAYKVVLTISA